MFSISLFFFIFLLLVLGGICRFLIQIINSGVPSQLFSFSFIISKIILLISKNPFLFSDCLFIFSFFFLNESLFIYLFFWLCWVFVSVRGLSLVAASGGHSSSQCAGLSLLRPLLLRSTSSRCAGSVVVAHTPSCSVAFGIFPDQGSNPCHLHWQADSQPLRHQGSPDCLFFITAWFHILWMQYFLKLV